MDISIAKDYLIYFFSILTCLGVPFLIIMTIVKNKKEIRIMEKFIDPKLKVQVEEYINEKKQINNNLNNYYKLLKQEIIGDKLEQSKERLQQLRIFQNQIFENQKQAKKYLLKLYDSYDNKSGYILHLLHAVNYSEKLGNISGSIETLIEIENNQMKNYGEV